MPKNNLPVVILVRPQLGQNIGAVARAMSNFGLKELRIVAPRDGWPNARAAETASGGEGIIHAATIFADFDAATADIHVAYATTARPRDMEKRVADPGAALPELKTQVDAGRRVALVFGPERTGLENEEIVRCDALMTIPTAPENSSLNIAQSAVVVFYEWWKQAQLPAVARELPEIAPKEDWQGLFTQLEAYLDEVNYYRVADKKIIMWQNLQNLLLRGAWSAQEVRSVRGMLRSIWERKRKGEG
jgi:tRNA/rRNA methyltransferase